MKPVYLVDASSLVRAIKEARLTPLAGEAIQWLTIYETLNAFWKEARLFNRISIEEATYLSSVLSSVIDNMTILDPKGLEQETIRIAVSGGSQSTTRHTYPWLGGTR